MTAPTAQAAADAARATRERAIDEAFWSVKSNAELIHDVLPEHPSELTGRHLKALLVTLNAMRFHERELAGLIAQRDGMPVSDGPDTGERRYG